jgi:hypothetical protein
MRARFVGDPRSGDDPETVSWLGVTFTKGEWEPVSAEVGSRLSKNDHFEVQAFNGADPAAFDHDGSGEPGGSLPVEPVKRKPGRPKRL